MYGKLLRYKTSAGKKRKQYRKRSTTTRRRTTMRTRTYRKNTPLIPSAEKKYIEHGVTNQPFAQLDVISPAYNIQRSNPSPIRGLGPRDRIGNKIFCTGSIMDLQIVTQSAVTNQIKFKYFIVRIPDCYDAPALDIVPAMFDPNPFVANCYDWHSNLDPEKTSQFKIIAKGQGTIKPDSLASQTGFYQVRRYLKLGFELKWDTDVILDEAVTNQWRLIFFADSGNLNTATGLSASMNLRTFYLDN